ncbi:MAG: hypothetical protein M1832_004824 [Thelocarpon impressellum]|nr:MAG: hypothetical protein M1832_004824 [Thelocarpon impressellum]
METQEPITPEDELLNWYHRLRPRSLDLVGDYAGQELFLVEGDSLLLECFSTEKLDFRYGFQLLHAVYAVENFLLNLVRRKCNFHIAFFEDNKHLCVPLHTSPLQQKKYLLARSAVIRHLTENLRRTHSKIEIHSFRSVRQPAFQQYLHAAGVYFVLCHDGAHEAGGSHKLGSGTTTPDAQYKELDNTKRLVFRGMIRWFITHGFNVALVDGVEWRDTKVGTDLPQYLQG